ncbi:AEC family transporter [Weeksella virosa]|uniref:Auxin Efflux Carrier n=1 Tax=Weeksella virosa (strain ATCC 43766 / DSM 16922 / JCM 21250 / CCUG 30538 / CDC 9751 / IAM 14551 / NBRC 16016 / NCTC 11634 / CL345/78) TaxID=865938 RepID=F0P1K7_WEEVC|nr:AEC family transporter [Weeksella virosa]ADX67635.1 Auxin Efflux Carrier [Weeksella virosa DSM 16922]VEH64740.1 auxin efflux carrier [Weeksella virosa]
MSSIILLFLCLLIGVIIKKFPQFPYNTHVVLNQFVLFISLPSMALYYLPEVKLGWDLLFPAGVAWLAFAMAFGFFYGLGKWLGWSKALIGCLILTAGLGNTSFVGIPVIQAMYGDEGIKTLIIVDLPGTFVVLSTLGIITATIFSRGENNLGALVGKVFKFPAFIAFLIGITMAAFGWHFPVELKDVFGKLAVTVSPLALVSVGYQLNIDKRSKHWNFLILGLLYQLIFLPIVIFVLYVLIFKQSGLPIKVSIIEAAMAPMVTAAIIAGQYGLKPKLSNMMVGIGIPISFITLTIWYFFLEWYFA